jgi:hypothetical protein
MATFGKTLAADICWKSQIREGFLTRGLGLSKTSLIILSALLLASCSETEYQQDNFSLDIPDGWAVIPVEVVDELLKKNGMPEGLFQLSLTTSENLPLLLGRKSGHLRWRNVYHDRESLRYPTMDHGP